MMPPEGYHTVLCVLLPPWTKRLFTTFEYSCSKGDPTDTVPDGLILRKINARLRGRNPRAHKT
ncbi:hypothetical protein RSAG8_00517, partial [Rhizoctonia solani AG-8 WAC10335]